MTYPDQILQLLGLSLFLGHCYGLIMTPHGVSPLLNQVCSLTETPDFCIATIGSSAADADLRGLTHISLDMSLSSALSNNAFIFAMLKNTTDSRVKQGLQHCSINYGGSVYALEEQSAGLDNGKYKEVKELVGIAAENTRDCERAFVQGPTHSSPMTAMNDKLGKLSVISDVFITLLLRPA